MYWWSLTRCFFSNPMEFILIPTQSSSKMGFNLVFADCHVNLRTGLCVVMWLSYTSLPNVQCKTKPPNPGSRPHMEPVKEVNMAVVNICKLHLITIVDFGAKNSGQHMEALLYKHCTNNHLSLNCFVGCVPM